MAYAQYWIVNGAKNALPFGTPAIPGYGTRGVTNNKMYASHAAAEAQMGAGNSLPTMFGNGNDQISQYPSGPQSYCSWATQYAVYYSRSGTLLGLFSSQSDAQSYCNTLGAGYVVHACTLSST